MSAADRPRELGDTHEARWLSNTRTTAAAAGVFAGLVLALVVALAAFGDHPFRYYSADPATTLSASSSLVGLMSHTGVLLVWGAAAVSVFAGVFVARARGWRAAAPVLVLGLEVGYLAMDDLFLLHESVFPFLLDVEEELVLAAYVAGLLVTLWWLRHFLRRYDWPLLAFALGALAPAVVLDLEEVEPLFDDALRRWLEDGTKLVGLSFLAAFLVRLSARMLVEAYPLARSTRAFASQAE